MDFRKRLLQRLSQDDIHEICFITQGTDNDSLKEELYTLISDEDVRVSSNALCMKLAYEQCKFFPELLSELSNCLEIISTEPLSSGLKTAKRNVMKKIFRYLH